MKRMLALLLFLAAPAFAQNPDLGVTLGNIAGPPQKRVEIAKSLGATWYRPEPVLLGQSEPKCEDCEAAAAAGLKLVLVVRNAEAVNKPAAAVEDITAFQQKLRQVVQRYKPAIIVIENEPEDSRSYAGTPIEYGAEVNAACEVAHATNIKCANGALSSQSIGGVVIDELWKTDRLEAASFGISTELVRTKSSGASLGFFGRRVNVDRETQEKIEKATDAYLDKHKSEIAYARAILSAGASASIDYANFHWYELKPEEITAVLDVLGRLSKHPPMTDEVGQQQQRPFETGEKIKILLGAGVRPIIWAGADGKDSVGLVDKNGNINPNGKAFQSAAQKSSAP